MCLSCERINKSNILNFSKLCWKIIRALISRFLLVGFGVMNGLFLAQMYPQNNYIWLLVLLLPLVLETCYIFKSRTTNQPKWFTPYIFFFLIGAVPSMWLVQLDLFNQRRNSDLCVTGVRNDMDEEFLKENSNTLKGINQAFILLLVLVKWISPKGDVSKDEISQLLLANLAAGGDIMELREIFNEDMVKCQRGIFYMVMVLWTWSLLQYAVVLTTSKELPKVENNIEAITAANADSLQGKDNTAFTDVREASPAENETVETESDVAGVGSPSLPNKKREEKVRKQDKFDAYMERNRMFECFCCYNELWGMTMGIIFQDGPFLIARLIILIEYKAVTQMNIFWAAKNAFVIILLLNRIRVVYERKKKTWKENMDQINRQRCSNV